MCLSEQPIPYADPDVHIRVEASVAVVTEDWFIIGVPVVRIRCVSFCGDPVLSHAKGKGSFEDDALWLTDIGFYATAPHQTECKVAVIGDIELLVGNRSRGISSFPSAFVKLYILDERA